MNNENQSLSLSAAGLALIMRSEGYRRTFYIDAAGNATIGYGHRIRQHEGYLRNGPISDDELRVLLDEDVRAAEIGVLRVVNVPLTQGQFDALVDFVFNLGIARLEGSTLLMYLNSGHYDLAAEEIPIWDHAGGKVLEGLKARREAELALWNAVPLETA